jgi:pilus assembly protein CpaE
LIVVASALDPTLMLEAMRSGVTECVTEIGRGDLEAAISRLVSQRSTPTAAGEVFAFLGAKGGTGTTTIAVNAATTLSTIASTLLIDMHIAGGDAALFLGADPGFSVIDALEEHPPARHRLLSRPRRANQGGAGSPGICRSCGDHTSRSATDSDAD